MTGFEWLIPIITNKFISFVTAATEDELKESVKKRLKEAEWEIFCRKYYRKIEEDYGKITLLLSGGEKVSLENFFVDVYLSDRSFLASNNRINGKRLLISSHETRLITKENLEFIYIEGHPGMGKTTFLKYAASLASRGEIEKVPIFVNLLDWSISGISLIDFLINEFDICGFPEASHLIDFLLEEGRVIILFDGLDEVREENEKRDKITREIQNFCRKYKRKESSQKEGNKFLITCRIAATKQNFNNFTYFRIAEFTNEQIILLIEKWFSNKNKNWCRKLKKEIFEQKNKNILELARQPLLLLMICYSFYIKIGEFPQNKVDIYETSIDALLDEWDANKELPVKRKFYEDLPISTRKFILSKIAYDNFSESNDTFSKFKKSYLEYTIALLISEITGKHKRLIPSNVILQDFEAQHGILVEVEDRIYKFPHLSFQEYFAARYIVEEKLIEQILTPEKIIQDRWREVILNVACILPQTSINIFFESFLNSINHFIAQQPLIKKFLFVTNRKVQNSKFLNSSRQVRYFYLFILLLNSTAIDNRLDFDRQFFLDFTFYPDFNLDDFIKRNKYFFSNVLFDQFRITEFYQFASSKPFERDIDLLVDLKLVTIIKYIETYYNDSNRHLPKPLIKDRISKNWKYLMKNLSGQLKVIDENFQTLVIPPKTQKEFTRVVEFFNKTLQLRKIDFEVNIESINADKLNSYLRVNSLLLECLDLAVTTNRQAIEDKMFLPFE